MPSATYGGDEDEKFLYDSENGPRRKAKVRQSKLRKSLKVRRTKSFEAKKVVLA